MPGTVILTGANGSLGIGYVQHLLDLYPDYTLVATVRNPSPENDANTAKLARVIAKKPGAKVSIEALNLGIQSDVRAFADSIISRVAQGKLPPISAIVCNAFTWSLNGINLTPDGHEATFQVSHLAHYTLVLKLLGSMDPASGRIVMLGSDSHYTDRPHPLTKLRARIPDNLDDIIKPPPDEAGNEHDRGFQRYGTAKLANITFMFDLNQRLEADPKLSHITVTAMDPGGLVDSRAHTEQKPLIRTVLSITSSLMPVVRHMTKAMRTSADSGKDLVALSVGPGFASKRGYFVCTESANATELSQDRDVQERLFNACWRWSGMSKDETALQQV